MLLFVYGTLKKEHQAHYWLYKSTFLGEAITADKYLLCRDKNLHYPYLLDIPVDYITGELYEISQITLNSIDNYEDHPYLFRRELIKLQDGREAYCYFYPAITQITTFQG